MLILLKCVKQLAAQLHAQTIFIGICKREMVKNSLNQLSMAQLEVKKLKVAKMLQILITIDD